MANSTDSSVTSDGAGEAATFEEEHSNGSENRTQGDIQEISAQDRVSNVLDIRFYQ